MKLDLANAYLQLPLEDKSRQYVRMDGQEPCSIQSTKKLAQSGMDQYR